MYWGHLWLPPTKVSPCLLSRWRLKLPSVDKRQYAHSDSFRPMSWVEFQGRNWSTPVSTGFEASLHPYLQDYSPSAFQAASCYARIQVWRSPCTTIQKASSPLVDPQRRTSQAKHLQNSLGQYLHTETFLCPLPLNLSLCEFRLVWTADHSAKAPQMLGVQVCITMPGSPIFFTGIPPNPNLPLALPKLVCPLLSLLIQLLYRWTHSNNPSGPSFQGTASQILSNNNIL